MKFLFGESCNYIKKNSYFNFNLFKKSKLQ